MHIFINFVKLIKRINMVPSACTTDPEYSPVNWVNQYYIWRREKGAVFLYERWPLFTKGRCSPSRTPSNIFSVRVGKFVRDMPSSSNEDCLTVVEVPENRYDEAIHHLKWNFFADEPLNNAVGLCVKGESQHELEQHCLLTLKQGYSRMLVNSKGEVSDNSLYQKIHVRIILFYFVSWSRNIRIILFISFAHTWFILKIVIAYILIFIFYF